MKQLPLSLLLALGLIVLCGTSFTKDTKASPQSTPIAHRGVNFYWYSYPDDEYNDYADIYDEENYWWYYYDGVVVNTNPIGGTLIARGYSGNSYPHGTTPSAWLYAHFTW